MTDFAAAQSPEGRAWLATVPSLLRDLAHWWDLTIATEQAWHVYHAVVLSVTQHGRPLALKLTWLRPPRWPGRWCADWSVTRRVPSVTAGQLASTRPARQRSLADPVPGQWVTLTADLARDPARMVHDLHYDNILTSSRSSERWVAIDPKPTAGAPDRSVAELPWT